MRKFLSFGGFTAAAALCPPLTSTSSNASWTAGPSKAFLTNPSPTRNALRFSSGSQQKAPARPQEVPKGEEESRPDPTPEQQAAAAAEGREGKPNSSEGNTKDAPTDQADNQEDGGVQLKKRSTPLRAPLLARILEREIAQENRRLDSPVAPVIPSGWRYFHTPGDQFLSLSKRVENERNQLEEMRIYFPLPIHHEVLTYNYTDGERMENAHYTFHLFVVKPQQEAQFSGGMEFILTCIDCELILDACVVHETKEELLNATTAAFATETKRDERYRGPSINELDDDLADEMINYLDDRGINNAFAEYITLQGLHAEDMNYKHYLELQYRFAKSLPAPKMEEVEPEKSTFKTTQQKEREEKEAAAAALLEEASASSRPELQESPEKKEATGSA